MPERRCDWCAREATNGANGTFRRAGRSYSLDVAACDAHAANIADELTRIVDSAAVREAQPDA